MIDRQRCLDLPKKDRRSISQRTTATASRTESMFSIRSESQASKEELFTISQVSSPTNQQLRYDLYGLPNVSNILDVRDL